MTIPDNVRAWVRTRLALHEFGCRYHLRLDLYAWLTSALLILLLVSLYARSFEEKDSMVLLTDFRFVVTLFVLVVWGSFYALALAVKAKTNRTMEDVEMEFLNHRLAVREHVALERRSSLPSTGAVVAAKSAGKEIRRKIMLRRRGGGAAGGSGNAKEEGGRRASWAREFCGGDGSPGIDIGVGPGAEIDDELRQELSRVEETLADHGQRALRMEEFEEMSDLLETAAAAVEAQMRVSPERFLGSPATWEYFSSYMAVWIGTIGLTLSLAGVQYEPA